MSISSNDLAKPLHIQRLEKCLRLEPFLSHVESVLNKDSSDGEDSEVEPETTDAAAGINGNGMTHNHGVQNANNGLAGSAIQSERKQNKEHFYNFSQVDEKREWLKDILLGDSSEDDLEVTEEKYKEMLNFHRLKRRYQEKYYSDPLNRQYMYYSAGLLSKHDPFPEHQKAVLGPKKIVKDFRPMPLTLLEKTDKVARKKKPKPKEQTNTAPPVSSTRPPTPPALPESKESLTSEPVSGSNLFTNVKIKSEVLSLPGSPSHSMIKIEPEDQYDDPDLDMEGWDEASPVQSPRPVSKGRKIKKEPEAKGKKKEKAPTVEQLNKKRRKLWTLTAKKEISKASKSRNSNVKEKLLSCKRTATACMRVSRQEAMQSQRVMKETVWRLKRMTREMQSYWKRYDRVERTQRRIAEKEAEEQRKIDFEIMEARRQQRKLNFLITQTELYAHFMSKKLGGAGAAEQSKILSQLEEEKNPRLAYLDDYDSGSVKERALRNVNTALHVQQQRTQQFDAQIGASNEDVQAESEFGQPTLFQGTLKTYQLKGMNWIANLYNQGINGILADEMGLGKTVQSIAFLAHIAERYDIWGPFLIVSPASTLHNWQQEMARFMPTFKVVPYWGSPQERKILRQFWTSKHLHTPEASFHVVITSYQLMVSDYKYFNRINWQYMVLDEAQAIKSASSARWKMLLEFNCRNRVLLSGTPIQNSMAELWALLHFIMPSLFDSHQEFSDWFSKDIESHAENKTNIDEKHLSRLHMILKPFMLRRIKKDVENELSDKIEIMMYCPLTVRQKALYAAIKKKIRIEDLLYSGGTSMSAQNVTSNLMNLVMQFRKVCNHPELFERREVKSALFWPSEPLVVPKLVYRTGILYLDKSKQHLLENKFSVWSPEYLQHSLFSADTTCGVTFGAFARFLGLTSQEVSQIMLSGLIARWLHVLQEQKRRERLNHKKIWQDYSLLEDVGFLHPKVPASCRFVDITKPGYTFLDVQLHPMAETLEHRRLRLKKSVEDVNNMQEMVVTEREIQTLDNQWVSWPAMLEFPLLKVNCRGPSTHVSDRSAAWWLEKHQNCSSELGKQCVLYGSPQAAQEWTRKHQLWGIPTVGGLQAVIPSLGWSPVTLPDKESLVLDSGKLTVLDGLLKKLYSDGHRVLIYSQMTRMIDLLEEYMWHRKLKYMRLDGSSKISERRDMVADFQSKTDIFVFLLSTRAGGLGINLTAADTVIFYDSDWNPTVDEQAMDRAHRLGQTKQVTVYRLICKGSIEERILQRAKEKSKIQRIVIAGGNFKPDTLKPTEVVSLLLDDEEIERKYRQRQAERRLQEEEREQERKRKLQLGATATSTPATPADGGNLAKKLKSEQDIDDIGRASMSTSASPILGQVSKFEDQDDTLVVDDNFDENSSSSFGRLSPLIPGMNRKRPGRGTGRRGRPPGPGKRGRIGSGLGRGAVLTPTSTGLQDLEEGTSSEIPQVGLASTSDGGNGSPLVKRGPGRPRLHPAGPAHQGTRGPPKKRGAPPGPRGPRVLKPLPVPLGTGAGTSTPLSQSPMSTPRPSPLPSPRPSPTPKSMGYYAPSSPVDER